MAKFKPRPYKPTFGRPSVHRKTTKTQSQSRYFHRQNNPSHCRDLQVMKYRSHPVERGHVPRRNHSRRHCLRYCLRLSLRRADNQIDLVVASRCYFPKLKSSVRGRSTARTDTATDHPNVCRKSKESAPVPKRTFRYERR